MANKKISMLIIILFLTTPLTVSSSTNQNSELIEKESFDIQDNAFKIGTKSIQFQNYYFSIDKAP